MKLISKLFVLVAVMGVSLSACHGKKPAEKETASVAVKVNGQPISVTELNQKAGFMGDSEKHPMSAQMLKMTIDTELIRQAAIQSKLDMDEKVRAAIANSNRLILASAYMNKQLSEISKPSEADISAYFNQHPERYANRKQFDIKEVQIHFKPGQEDEIRAQIAKLTKPEALIQWLQSKQIENSNNQFSGTSDQIQEDAMQKLKDVPVGGSVVLADKDQLHALYVLKAVPDPIELSKASPSIAKFLVEKRRKEVMDNTFSSLREKAKIEYMPPYSEAGSVAPANK